MKKLAFALALISFSAAASDDFSDREARAKKLERTPDGLEYLMGFMQHVDSDTTEIMGHCFRHGEIGTTDSFTVVADIQADGTIANVAVQPTTDGAQCYAEKFGQVKAPSLPAKFQRSGFPIVIHASQTYKAAP